MLCTRCENKPVKKPGMCLHCASIVAGKSRGAVGGVGFFPIRKKRKTNDT